MSSPFERFPSLLVLLRPKHWIKNLACFLPVFCAGGPIEKHELVGAGLAFLAFCFGASFVYTVNDLADLNRDRLHPQKRLRPLAAGSVGRTDALFVAAGALVLCSMLALSLSPSVLGILGTYIATNIWYSLRLKQVAVLDAMMISAGFILRLAAVSQVSGV